MLNMLINAAFAVGLSVNCAVTGFSDIIVPFKKKNRSHNSKLRLDSFVHDQTAAVAARLKMGYMHCSFNGCGCFAAYNAALLKGKRVNPVDIIKYYENLGGIVLDGLLGVNPLAVSNVLKRIGFDARIHNFPKDLDKLAAASETAIIVYAHKQGMHFVAVQHTEGAYRVYNEHVGATAYRQYPSLNKWLKNTANYLFAVSLIQVF